MKTIGKLIAAAAIVLGSASGATVSTASAPPPWYADTVYYTGGVATGATRYYCDGRIRDTGDVWTYDDSVHTVYYECP